MLFTTDTQTIEDLNIFGRQATDQTVFGIFNQCLTKGGSAILEQMFRNPLSNHSAINNRSGTIRYFASNGMAFPFRPDLFPQIEQYLAITDERTRLVEKNQPLVVKTKQWVAPETETVLLQQGVRSVVQLLQSVFNFISSAPVLKAGFYAEERTAIAYLLSIPDFADALAAPAKLSSAMVSGLDSVFRFRNRSNLRDLLKYCYQLDVYTATAKVAVQHGFAFADAVINGDALIDLDGFYHPTLVQAVPNTIRIDHEHNIVFLTGANMAGKSTLMKALSLAVYLAHMGFPLAAKSMKFTVMNGIYTTINLPDNLSIGASHFYTEVLRLKKIAGELANGARLFIVFDELFRGTNVKDAFEATIAVTGAFANRRNSLFIISTHIMEAGEVLQKGYDNIRFTYLPTGLDGNKPIYTYSLKNGISSDRHGMVIVRNEGILQMLEEGAWEI